MAQVKTLIDKNGSQILPRTRVEAITLSDGTTLLEDHLVTLQDGSLTTPLVVDANTLNGQPASYYAATSTMNNNVETRQLKNWIINGGFDVWQRGTSFTANGYTADRWFSTFGSNTLSRQDFTYGQTEVPNSPTYFYRINISTNAQNAELIQRIEDVKKFSGKTMTLSYWIKSSSSSFTGNSDMYIHFGDGGSALLGTTGGGSVTITTSWTKVTKTFVIPQFTGKTIGNNNFVWVRILQVGSTNTGTIDIANVSLVEGTVPVEWQTESYADALRQCQRYYVRMNAEKSYTIFGQGSAYSTVEGRASIPIKESMRICPTSVEYYGAICFTLLTTAATNITALYIDNFSSSSQNVILTVVVASGLTTNSNLFLESSNNITSYIGFSAEL